jgi:hypothetical protein
MTLANDRCLALTRVNFRKNSPRCRSAGRQGFCGVESLSSRAGSVPLTRPAMKRTREIVAAAALFMLVAMASSVAAVDRLLTADIAEAAATEAVLDSAGRGLSRA